MNDIELTTMCAVMRDKSVLMINRKKSWLGWAFPGGHLEAEESAEECVKRELLEEAGICLKSVRLKGFTNIYNNRTMKRHIIFNYKCSQFEVNVRESCEEEDLAWLRVEELDRITLAEGMEYRLPLFLREGCRELYIEWNEEEGYTRVAYQGE